MVIPMSNYTEERGKFGHCGEIFVRCWGNIGHKRKKCDRYSKSMATIEKCLAVVAKSMSGMEKYLSVMEKNLAGIEKSKAGLGKSLAKK